MGVSFVCNGGTTRVLSSSCRAPFRGKWVENENCLCTTRKTPIQWITSKGKTRVPVECKRGGRYPRSGHGEGRRSNRVGEMIRREVGRIIDDTVSSTYRSETGNTLLISVVDVKCSSDLRNARVSISVLGSNDDRREAVTYLRQSAKEIRYQLAQCIRMKYVPDLSFVESELADATNTVNILNKLAREREEKALRRSELENLSDAAIGVEAGLPSTSRDNSLDYDASAEDALIFDDDDDEEDDDGNLDGLHIVDIEDTDDETDDDERPQRGTNRTSEWFNDMQSNKRK